jgi:hypothetical protein
MGSSFVFPVFSASIYSKLLNPLTFELMSSILSENLFWKMLIIFFYISGLFFFKIS